MAMPKILPHKRGGYYMNPTFGGRRVSIYGKTEEEITQKYIQKCYEVGLGVKLGPKVTVAEYLRQWVKIKYDSQEIADYTYTGYKGNIENHIIPLIGNMAISKVTAADIKTLYATKRKESKAIVKEREKLMTAKKAADAAKTDEEKKEAKQLLEQVDMKLAKRRPLNGTSIHYIHRVLSAAFTDARSGNIILNNPIDGVKPPEKAEPPEKKAIPVSSVQAVFEKIKGKEYEIGTHMAVAVGMRRGELCAVEWEDIDWDRKMVVVSKAISQTSVGGLKLKKTKSKKKREAALPDGLIDMLKKEKRRQEADAEVLGDAYMTRNRLITTDGSHYELDNVVRHRDGTLFTPYAMSISINAAIKAAKVDTTLHGLRVEYISLGYKYKADSKAISESAGHHSDKFTREVYQAVFDEMKHELAGSIDEALYSSPEEPSEGQGKADVVKKTEKEPALHIHYNG